MKNIKFLLAFTFIFVALSSVAQGREYIRQQIKYRGECRNVAITKTNGDIMLYGRNGYATTACPTGLANEIKKLNRENQYINDVQLTESGRWIVLYGSNGCSWHNIPYSLEKKIREFNRNKEVITSITFNDAGQWIVITTQHYCASEKWIQDWLQKSARKFGMLWAACITDDAMVAVYQNGFATYGDTPVSLSNALKRTTLDVYRLKIAGTAWFMADKYGNYQYKM